MPRPRDDQRRMMVKTNLHHLMLRRSWNQRKLRDEANRHYAGAGEIKQGQVSP